MAKTQQMMQGGVAVARLEKLAARAARHYAAARPACRKALRKAGGDLPAQEGWPQPFPPVLRRAQGTVLVDLDGHELADFHLGGGDALFGHAPEPLTRAIRAQSSQGLAPALPDGMAVQLGALISRHWGARPWQIAASAAEARRAALQLARARTGRDHVLVCHRSAPAHWLATRRAEDPSLPAPATIRFNDLPALRRALKTGQFAAIFLEPALSRGPLVPPDPGFHAAAQQLAQDHGTWLIMDESHSQSCGPGGYCHAQKLSPDILLAGGPIAGGLPAAIWGLHPAHEPTSGGHSAHPMQAACLGATLKKLATPRGFARMEAGTARLETGLMRLLHKHRSPWHLHRFGAEIGLIFAPDSPDTPPPLPGAVLHQMLLNDGCLIAPSGDRMRVSPETRRAQIDRLLDAFDTALRRLSDQR